MQKNLFGKRPGNLHNVTGGKGQGKNIGEDKKKKKNAIRLILKQIKTLPKKGFEWEGGQ